jgi:hypothetical protein
MSTLLATATDTGRPITKHRVWTHLGIFLCACVVIILRRPDCVTHAQFYAEDGAIWFAQAYNYGAVKVLFWTYNGYVHLLPRLAAAAALLAPLRDAPLVENLVAIVLAALPVSLLLSPRSAVWGTLRFRLVLASLYLLLPNTSEMIGTVTESQWMLALCTFLILIASPPTSTKGKAADLFLVSLCSLTGPFCFFLWPLALRKRLYGGILLAGSVLQGVALLLHHSRHFPQPLGAGAEPFVRILSGQVYLGTLLGTNLLGTQLSLKALAAVMLAGCLTVVLAARQSPPMRRLIFLAAALFAASLLSPVTVNIPETTQWQLLALAAGAHYWFFPCLAFSWSIAWCFRSRSQLVQIGAATLAALLVIGTVRDFRYPAFPDGQFPFYAAQVDAAPKNAVITIPLVPPGWKLQLVKR